ncbi:EamA family transporter [Alkaliphilus sp. B6464]|uniref:EamA family transporter n=1 Tax=Alkaliphilus sp. B6464 TaxID=2731219 RepID=UPI001BA9DD37|nr:EamA family transporter [Alkaliphilus sp. B6464]QUH18469.1 EamA family transporter [Alkaliphilus sp. B6464]
MTILLSLIGMICWGIAPILAKIGLKAMNPITGLALRSFITTVIITLYINIDSNVVKLKDITFYGLLFIGLEAVFSTIVGDIAYYAAIKKGNVSLVTMIMSASPVVTLFGAMYLLGEQITITKIIGVLLVILGIILIA